MKKIILLVALTATIALQSQTTFDLDWAIGINGEAASLTIEPGDTVRWTWTDAMPHNVVNKPGSQEIFDSGTLIGIGEQYSFTFTEVGINDYECTFHTGSMFGTITVEEELSIEDKFLKNIIFYPNPVKNIFTLSSLFELDSFKIYNTLGSLVYEKTGNNRVIEYDMSHLQSGVYILVVASNSLKKTFKIVKN
ncbi:MAG: T9SS type A sorting domain-containing protein [Flavobacteriaceae bacterium]|nr:T9SS type A sorting domain-containing protein [Flavobacteriaceae bacterium]